MMASLLVVALAAAPSSATPPFQASFTDLEIIGQSNYTHFWMPAPLTLSSSLPSARLMAHVDLCGDGTVCPPPGHPQGHGAYFSEASTGGPWSATTSAADVATCTVIRINSTVTRGFGAIKLDLATNTSATCAYEDWIQDRFGHVHSLTPGHAQWAPITGLPRMVAVAYFMPSPSAVVRQGSKEVHLTQFYGYIAGKTEGCTYIKSRGCYSVVTIASEDKGASWKYTSSINWDDRMPAHVEGPCESALATMADGKTLLSVFRVTSYQNMWQAVSTDGGATFSAPSEINAWAVFPELRALPSGALVLTAGRPGIGLWLADGTKAGAGPEPMSWSFYNLAQEHNKLAGTADPAIPLYPAPELAVANASSVPSKPCITKAYTGLEFIGCERASAVASSSLPLGSSSGGGGGCTVVVSYDRLSNGNAGPDPPGPHGPVDAAFTMHVTVTPTTATSEEEEGEDETLSLSLATAAAAAKTDDELTAPPMGTSKQAAISPLRMEPLGSYCGGTPGGAASGCDETTPIMWHGALMLVERHQNFRVRRQAFAPLNQTSNALLIDGVPGSKGVAFVSATVVNHDTLFLFGTNNAEMAGGKPRTQVHAFWSNDAALKPATWHTAKILQLPQNGTAPPGSWQVPWWTAFNTSPTKGKIGGKDVWVLAIELGSPAVMIGRRFTSVFAVCEACAVTGDLSTGWKVLDPSRHIYRQDRYSACPTLRWYAGFFCEYL